MGERDLSRPTKSPRKLLGRIANGAKEAGISIAFGLTYGGPIALALRRERLAEEAEMVQAGRTPRSEAERTILTQQERRTEGMRLVNDFVAILEPDPEVQGAVLKAFFKFGKEGGPSSEARFKRGTGEYSLDTTSGDYMHGDIFRITRTEGRLRETLYINIGRLPIDQSSIHYNAYDTEAGYRMAGLLNGHVGEISEKNNSVSVNGGRGLLAKMQRDFGITVPPSAPRV